MSEDFARWVGDDEHGGLPSLARPDAPRPKQWSLEAVAAVERPHDARVSPAGDRVAFILDRDTSDVWVVPVAGGPPVRVTVDRPPALYWEDTTPSFSPDGSWMAYAAHGAVWLVAAAGGLPRRVAEADNPEWIDDASLLVTVDREDVSRLAVCSVADPWPVAVTPPDLEVWQAAVVAGRRRFAHVGRHKAARDVSTIFVTDLDEGTTRALTHDNDARDHSPAPSPDGSHIAFVSNRTGWDEIHVVDVASGEVRRLTKEDCDLSSPAWHPDGSRILAARTRHGLSELVVVDPVDGSVAVLAEGGTWTWPAWAAGGVAVAVHEGFDSPPTLVAVSADGGRRSLVGPAPAAVRAATHVLPEEVRFASLDGLEIHGFLFRPAPPGPVPAVVYPHGGPTAHYADEWDGHAQYFVDKGYAWLAVNFRGSTSYGREFERANRGQWGVTDTDDCLAAADFLADLDWIDPERIAIFGPSYGSYLALSALARDPQHRFACGVAKYGDSDITTSWATGDRGGREDVERMMGRPAQARAMYREGSPLHLVDRIERPILVAHGMQDERVPPAQSRQLVDALARHHKTFEYITYPTEGHGFLRREPQLHFYRRLERFLDWYLM